MQTILVVDDDISIRKLLITLVGTLGNVKVLDASNGSDALALAQEERPDLIISDVAMPGMTGLELVRAVREDAQLGRTLILLLTARGEALDRYEGLGQGADDYVVKPFDPVELQLRVKAMLRRAEGAAPPAGEPKRDGLLPAGPYHLDLKRSTLVKGDRELRLTAAEQAILRYLAEHPDELVSVSSLLQHALQYPPQASNPAIIHTHVRNIRVKCREADFDGAFLSSSRQGYMLVTTG